MQSIDACPRDLGEVLRILAPGIFELSGTRVAAARVLIAALYLAFASAAVVLTHTRLLPLGGLGSTHRSDDTFSTYPPAAPPMPS